MTEIKIKINKLTIIILIYCKNNFVVKIKIKLKMDYKHNKIKLIILAIIRWVSGKINKCSKI